MNFRKLGCFIIAGAITTAASTTVVQAPGAPAPQPVHDTKTTELKEVPHVLTAVLVPANREITAPKRDKTEVEKFALSRGGEPPSEVLQGFEITWYNNDYDKTDKTASGATTIDGRTISVDPKVIPLGSWVYIYMPDGRILVRHAEDTGSAVKGRIIDVYADLPKQALLERGRARNVTIRVFRGD